MPRNIVGSHAIVGSSHFVGSGFLVRRSAPREGGSRTVPAAIALCLLLVACGPTDPAIQTAVDAQLAVDTVTAPVSIDISVNRGVVRLSGDVESRDQQRRAVELARSVRGVEHVIDEMRLSDAAVVAAVKRALAADPMVGKIPIDVDSSAGNIRLKSDQTGKDDRTRAVEVASKIDGVANVEDLMR
jgi:osmotically-inducible protein OsmY